MRLISGLFFTVLFLLSFDALAQSSKAIADAAPAECQPSALAKEYTTLVNAPLKIRLPHGWTMAADNQMLRVAQNPEKNATIQLSGPTAPGPDKDIASMMKRIQGIYLTKGPIRVQGQTLYGAKTKDLGLVVNGKNTWFVEMYQSIPAGQRSIVYGVYEGKRGLYEISSMVDHAVWQCQQKSIFASIATLQELE